jgi:hypothetical protein
MGLFGIPDLITDIRDDNLKQQLTKVAVSATYSQYITFLYTFGKSIEGKWAIGLLAKPLQTMAASLFKMLQLQDQEKFVALAVPQALSNDKALLDSIYFLEEKRK